MSGKKSLFFMVFVLGCFVFSMGVMFAGLYFWKGIISRIGEADQSLMFWYLPIFFIGFGVMVAGSILSVWGWKQLKES